MAAPAAPGDLAAQVQVLVDLVICPNQTSDQLSAGQLSYVQLRDLVLRQQRTLSGTDPTSAGIALSYDQIVEHVRDVAPKVVEIRQAVDVVNDRVANVESKVDPVLQRADAALKSLKEQSDDIKTKVDLAFQNMQQKHEELIGHAQEKFGSLEGAQKSVVDSAKDKFEEILALQQQFETQVAVKVSDIDTKLAEVTRVYTLLVGMGEQDVIQARARVADAFGRNTRNTKKEISEYKAVTALEKFTGDNRVGYGFWLYKLKNTLDQCRSAEWRKILDALERHRIGDDFEELLSVDDKWDDWFQTNFGDKRADGGEVVDLQQFKADISWILTDKLSENLLDVVRKHDQNGVRSYKKLYIWSKDISVQAKHARMERITSPDQCKKEEDLADAIEKWDRDRLELQKCDPACELKDPFVLIAFKKLLPDSVSRHIETQLDSRIADDYVEVRKKVYGYALRCRVSAKTSGRHSIDHMDVPDLPDLPGPTEAPSAPGNQWGGGYGSGYGKGGNQAGVLPNDQRSTAFQWFEQMLEAIGKGKGQSKGGKSTGKGKGQISCWRCGKAGHIARNCTNPPMNKGKGKGKGGGKGMNSFEQGPTGQEQSPTPPEREVRFEDQSLNAVIQGYCYNCWEWGHPARDCPKPPKGKGKGKGGNIASLDAGISLGGGNGNGGGAAPGGKIESLMHTTDQPGDVGDVPPTLPPWQVQTRRRNGKEVTELKVDLTPKFMSQGYSQCAVDCRHNKCERAKAVEEKGRTMLHNMFSVLSLDEKDEELEIPEAARDPLPAVRPGRGRWKSRRNLRQIPERPIMSLENADWRELRVTIDSGACDHVVSPNDIDVSRINADTQAVRESVTYYTASGHALPNLGEVRLEGRTGDGAPLDLTMQVAGVRKTLASVRKMCEAGNRVVFEDARDNQGGYVEHIESGVRIPILKDGGTYQVAFWVPQSPTPALDNVSDAEDEHEPSSSSGLNGEQGFTRLP